jgi:hypothetical protein
LLARAARAGTHIGAFCAAIHLHQGEVGIRRILGVLSLAKKFGVAAVEVPALPRSNCAYTNTSSVLGPESALGSFPNVALSSAQAGRILSEIKTVVALAVVEAVKSLRERAFMKVAGAHARIEWRPG